MLKIYLQAVGLIASIIVTLYVCPRLISLVSDADVILGVILLIIMIPFTIWQVFKLIKSIINQYKKIGEKTNA